MSDEKAGRDRSTTSMPGKQLGLGRIRWRNLGLGLFQLWVLIQKLRQLVGRGGFRLGRTTAPTDRGDTEQRSQAARFETTKIHRQNSIDL